MQLDTFLPVAVFHGPALLANSQWCHNQDQADQSRSHFSVQGVCSSGGRMGWPITDSLAVQILLLLLRCCVLILNPRVRLVCPERWSTKNVKLMWDKRKFLEEIALTSKKKIKKMQIYLVVVWQDRALPWPACCCMSVAL